MNYAAFKDHLITFLWKMGDTFLIDRLDSLVTMANHELNRSLKVERRHVLADLTVSANPSTLPADFRSMRNLSSPTLGEMIYVVPAEYARLQAGGGSSQASFGDRYTTSGKTLRIVGPTTVDTPVDLLLLYYADVPDFVATDDSWVADEYLDIYTYCCLKHSAPFLREDERIPIWSSLFASGLVEAIDDDQDRKYSGSPLNIKFPKGTA